MVTSPFAAIHLAIIERITAKAPAIRYIDQDLGQLDNYDLRPAVSWPAVLIDVADDWAYTENNSLGHQQATGSIVLRLALVKYTDSNNLTPANIRANGLQYFEAEQQVIAALHHWAPPGCSRLLRRRAFTEKRDDDIRVRNITFAISFTDMVAQPATTTVPRPAPVVQATSPQP